MNLLNVDLNLLLALDALLRERHVGRAAAAIGRSQPAVSHALSRLRALFGDPLLVRSGRRMALSPRAETLREPLAAVLRGVNGLLSTPPFDPATVQRTFRVMMPDYIADLVMPRLMAELLCEAPGVRVEIAEWRGEKTLTPSFLDAIDLVISGWIDRFIGFHPEPLFEDEDVMAARAGRRIARYGSNLEAFLDAPHVAVVGPGERQDPVDAWLASLGFRRRIALSVPTYLLALRSVAESDLIAVAPRRLAVRLGPAIGVRFAPLPVAPGVDVMHMHAPAAAQSDPASLWFRGLVRASI